MQIRYKLTVIAKCLFIIAGTAQANTAVTTASDFEVAIDSITRQVNRYPLQPLQLDFAAFLQTLPSGPQHSLQVLESLTAKTNALIPADSCQSIAKRSLTFQLQLMTERHHLTKATKSRYPGTFAKMPNGREWYQHWLASWLQHNVSLTELQEIAHEELLTVATLRQQLQQQPLPKGADQRFLRHQHTAIVHAFQQREGVVHDRLAHLFTFDTAVEPVHIVASTLPKDFPAPGIYDPTQAAFIYHLQTDELPEAHMDWLFLHEGVPGHHFQHILANKFALCPSSDDMSMVMREGWAAYVETLGAEIGLFNDQASYAYALQWRTLRALRVLIDIGIHAHDWSDERAEALWLHYLPDNPRLMQREIARVKRWPAQAITYVYGKHVIEQMMLKYATPRNENAVRSIIFQLTQHLPLALDYVPQFIKPDSDKTETF
jgi:uncharacterized protein (DUF885 family)